MTDTFKVLYQGQPGVTATTIYTVPGATQAVIKQIRVVNMHATLACTIKLWHKGTADTNVILPLVTIQPGEWGEFDGLIVAAAAEVFSAIASVAASVTVTMYGLEIS